MPRLKKILLIGGIGIIAFSALLVYALSDSVRNVTDRVSFTGLTDAPLTLKRTGYLVSQEAAVYRFTKNTLTAQNDTGGRLIARLPAGTSISLQKFKTYTNAVSGFTHLYALGSTRFGGKTVDFEYDWGGLDVLFAPERSVELPIAIWQDSMSAKTLFVK